MLWQYEAGAPTFSILITSMAAAFISLLFFAILPMLQMGLAI
ncbi:hypothetical protein HMPREF3202_00505 [Prevotella bivia]|uniref:Uncharacterized protein n=1 Tax=Prevotella bivia TaxID=28125 RepID=A0A137SZX1_9BACT|nr:hypothetical protein HMPREF3202_00505 [Prevotella bivia]